MVLVWRTVWVVPATMGAVVPTAPMTSNRGSPTKLVVETAGGLTDQRDRAVGVLRRIGKAGADRPDGFVRNDQRRALIVFEMTETVVHLLHDALQRESGIVFVERFADADDRRDADREQRRDFLRDRFVGFAEMLAPLRMTD